MAWRGTAAAMTAGLLLVGCADDGSVPIYIGANRVATVGGSGGAVTMAGGTGPQAESRSQGLTLDSIFASGGTPIYIGGRRVNCPEGQRDC